MAFKSFDSPTGGTSNDLPWVNEFVASNPQAVGEVYNIRHIRTTPKGIMLGTDSFMAFLFKSVAMHNYLLEFCNAWQGKEKKCPRLQLQLTTNKPYFLVGCDDQETGVLSKQDYGWYQACRVPIANPENPPTNPLPLPSGSNPPENNGTTPATDSETSQMLPLEAPPTRHRTKK